MAHSNAYDVIIIGAGPAGLSLARSLADTTLKVAIIDPASAQTLQNPPPDGREIALTHYSKELLQAMGAWDAVPEGEMFFLRSAKVVDGTSPFELHFETPEKARGKPADTLGYLISNHHIRQSLYSQVVHQANLTWFTEQKVQTVGGTLEQAHVVLASGEKLTAPLVVAADSRFSTTRQQMGIPVDMHDFGRTVITFRIEHTASNENTAFECFHYGRTLAILPLTENLSSAVITIDTQLAHQVQDADDEALAQDLVQEGFLRAWRSLADLRDDKAAKAWLMTIVRREHARLFERKVPPLDDIADLVIEDRDNPSAYELKEIQEMRDAIGRIDDKYREPLLLQLVGGFSCEEIADQLGITASAVMTQLFRARAKLKALLRGDSEGKIHELL